MLGLVLRTLTVRAPGGAAIEVEDQPPQAHIPYELVPSKQIAATRRWSGLYPSKRKAAKTRSPCFMRRLPGATAARRSFSVRPLRCGFLRLLWRKNALDVFFGNGGAGAHNVANVTVDLAPDRPMQYLSFARRQRNGVG